LEDQPINTLVLIDQITEFNDLTEFMQDEQLDRALELVIKLLVKPNVPPSNALALIIELQALSAKFSVMATYYSTIKRDRAGTESNHKKNVYYTMSDSINKLVDALKYSARYGVGV